MIYFYIIISFCLLIDAYNIPRPTIQAFKNGGLRASISDEPGIALFSFHGKINQPFKGPEPGDFYGEQRYAQNGKWLYDNMNVNIQKNDVLHYWIFVQHDKLGYEVIDQQYLIRDLQNRTNGSISSPSTTRQTTIRPITNQVTQKPSTVTTTTSTTTSRSTPAISTVTTEAPSLVDCELSQTIVMGKNVCKGSLIFDDEFVTSSHPNWNREIKIPLDTEDAEFVSYQNSPTNLFNRDNSLWFVPRLQTDYDGFNEERMRLGELNLNNICTGVAKPAYECYRKAQRNVLLPPVVSAKLSTKNLFSFKYGKIEIRAKFPSGDWILPQLYLEPAESFYGSNGYASGQMRIASIRGNEILETKDNTQIDGYMLSGGLVLSALAKQRSTWMKTILNDQHFGDTFHTYSLTWTNKAISVSLDGQVYANYRGPLKSQASANNITQSSSWNSVEPLSPFDREFYISLGVGVGGMGDFPDLCVTGTTRIVKPWNNTSPTAELNFWRSKDVWYPTWAGNKSALQIDYVRVWAL